MIVRPENAFEQSGSSPPLERGERGSGRPLQIPIGYRFPNSRLVVIGEATARIRAGRGARRFWVRCDCGKEFVALLSCLRNGGTKSCGCLHKEMSAAQVHRATAAATKVNTIHGHTVGRRQTPTYHSWDKMLDRCLNPNQRKYKFYGGIGITVCDRWNPAKGGSFKNFLEDMGERPEGTTLGRFADTGDYEPINCKWMTGAEQKAEQKLKRARTKRAA